MAQGKSESKLPKTKPQAGHKAQLRRHYWELTDKEYDKLYEKGLAALDSARTTKRREKIRKARKP